MNDKIKQIALECYNPYSNFDINKFAELIVRECSHLLTVRDGRTEPAPHIYLLKSFGIDE